VAGVQTTLHPYGPFEVNRGEKRIMHVETVLAKGSSRGVLYM